MTARSGGRIAVWCVAVLSLLFFVQGFFGSRYQSLTWDEPSFLSAGYLMLTRGDFRFNPSHPPLTQQLIALPLLFLDLNPPEGAPDVWFERANPVVSFGHAFLYESGNDPLRIATWSRLPILLLGTALLWMMFLWGRRLYGAVAALVGVALAALSPNLLAHAKVATEDLSCAAFLFAAVWTFWRGLESGRKRDWALSGLVTGLALLAKYTSLLLGPIFLILLAGTWSRWRRTPGVGPVAAGTAILFAVAFLVVGAGYGFPFGWSTYLAGVSSIYGDLVPGYRYYLLGSVSDTPRWYFNLVGFALKVPLPALILIGLAAWRAIRDRDRGRGRAALFLLVPALVVVGASFFDRANLGLRRILPAFPFLFLFASASLAADAPPRAARRRRTIVVAALLGWSAVVAVRIFPYHLSYLNEIAGGPTRGPYVFDDSNVDWGQDLPALARWEEEHPEARPLRLLYFGTAQPEAYGVEAVRFPPAAFERPTPGYYAISAHYLVWLKKMKKLNGRDIDWLAKYRPHARAGYSIYIYRFPAAGS